METQNLAEMIAVRKTKPRPRKLKEDSDDEYPKPPRKKTTVEDDAKLAPILAGKLGTANMSLKKTKNSLYKSNDRQIETYGRLYKYEGKPIIEETLAYAERTVCLSSARARFLESIQPSFQSSKVRNPPSHTTRTTTGVTNQQKKVMFPSPTKVTFSTRLSSPSLTHS